MKMITALKEFYEAYDEENRLATCQRRDMLGYSNHLLDIFKKNE